MSTDDRAGKVTNLFGKLFIYMRRFIFRILSVGPLPNHIAFIMDGNRRYAANHSLKEGDGHRHGFSTLVTLLKYCSELGIKYISIFAFSIDNFRRQPEEVKMLMDLMAEKIEGMLKEESVVNEYGVRVHFVGNLKLLNQRVRIAAEKVMAATATNTKTVLLVCVAYTSSDEIVHAVQESFLEKKNEARTLNADHVCNEVNHGPAAGREERSEQLPTVKVTDIERHMYMALAPNPDILLRSSGETRLSNFFLWQSANCLLYCPAALWPEIGLRHVIWAVLNFQRQHRYLEKKKKQS
ncbi:hypothetical protein Ancab_003084 [Ancistrocladus abbreviatus]